MRNLLTAEQAKIMKAQDDLALIQASKQMKPYMKVLENSSLAKFRDITDRDALNLSKHFANFDAYLQMMNSSASIGDLGRLPIIKYQFLTFLYGENMMNIVTSPQTVDENAGDILYKSIIASDNAGSVTKGQILASGNKAPDNWALDDYGFNGGKPIVKTGDGATTTFTITVGQAIVKNAVSIVTDIPVGSTGAFASARDDGYGNLLGLGCSGSVSNYSTGAISVTFAEAPAVGKEIKFYVTRDVEEDGQIPRFYMGLNRKHVECETIALAGEFGIFQDFTIFKKTGKSSDADLIQDLTNLINFQLFNRFINDLALNIPTANQLTWTREKSEYVTYAQSAPEIGRKISQLDGAILQTAGRGEANILCAGTNAIADLEFQDGFEKVSVGGYGARVKGKYKGRVVIVNPAQNKDTIFGFYKGDQDFDGAGYTATYMPLAISDIVTGRGGNNAKRERVAATWATTGVAVPEMTAKIELIDKPINPSSSASQASQASA